MDYIRENPLSKIGNFKQTLQIKKEMNVYTPEEFLKFINEIKNAAQLAEEKGKIQIWDYYVFFNIAFYMGMRKGEILALKWSDIDNNKINVTRSISQKLKGGDRETAPKNASSVRSIVMPQCLIQILNEHYARWQNYPKFNKEIRICSGTKPIRDTH